MIKYYGLLLFLMAMVACVDEDMTFQIGSNYVDVNSNIRFLDTLTVHSFTMRLDSVRTSSLDQPSMVVGQYTDPEFGTLTAGSFFRVNPPASINLPANAEYDSLRLVMLYNDYVVGDTNKPYTIRAHRLTGKLKKREDGYLYNTSLTAYDPDPLGAVSLVPRPGTYDTLTIRLDDDLGRELFYLLDEDDPIILENELFYNFFNGFTLQNNESNQAVLGFEFPSRNTASNATTFPVMRLYYHYFDFENRSKYIDFPVGSENVALQYNQFGISDPVVDFPVKQRDKLPASQTGNKTYVQAGIGVITRLEIPYLRNILALHENIIVMKAELQIEPIRETYGIYPLPEDVRLYGSDAVNRFEPSFVAGADLTIDEIYQEETWYTFDVTTFIKNKLVEETDETPSLLFTIAPDDLNKTFERIVVGSQHHPDNRIKLKLYYLTYE